MSKRRQELLAVAADLFTPATGIGVSFSVHFIGDVYLSEILLLLALPAMLYLRGRRALRSSLKTLYFFMGLWLLGQVISDAFNHTPIRDSMRGAGLILFFGLSVLAMSILIGHNEKRKMLFFVGLMLGTLASVRFQPTQATVDYPWKFGYAWGITLLVLLIGSHFYAKRQFLISGLLLVAISAVNLMFNYRGPILEILVTLALVYPIIPDQIAGLRLLPQSNLPRLVVLAGLSVIAAATSQAAVRFVTQAGYISGEAQAKNESQEKSGNLLLGGRPEFAVGFQAALDHPIVGHGSWAKDYKYFEMLNDQLVENGTIEYDKDFDLGADGLIPGHSHIITAWVWSGIAGLIFWAYLACFVFAGVTRFAILRPSFVPIYVWLLIAMLWDIFFSPFAAGRRTLEAVLIIIVADLTNERVAGGKTAWRRMGAAVRRPALAMPITDGPISDGPH